jgi:hypothetical protein
MAACRNSKPTPRSFDQGRLSCNFEQEGKRGRQEMSYVNLLGSSTGRGVSQDRGWFAVIRDYECDDGHEWAKPPTDFSESRTYRVQQGLAAMGARTSRGGMHLHRGNCAGTSLAVLRSANSAGTARHIQEHCDD